MQTYIHSDMASPGTIDIKALREKLGLNQAELARTLCVTQATVARWEPKKGATRPTGDAARRLHQLHAMTATPKEKKLIQETLRAEGGIDAVAALLSLGGAIGGSAMGFMRAGGLFGPAGIAGSLAAGLLYRLLGKVKNERAKKKTKSDE